MREEDGVMDTWQILTHPFSLGLGLGLVFTVLAVFRLWGAKRELARYKRLLSDKLEAEAEASVRGRQEREKLARENENLKAHVQALQQLPDRSMARDLEVYARAERRLILQVPGFAQAWETAKQEVLTEIEGQEAGAGLPRKVFRKLFGVGSFGEPSGKARPAPLTEARATSRHNTGGESEDGRAN